MEMEMETMNYDDDKSSLSRTFCRTEGVQSGNLGCSYSVSCSDARTATWLSHCFITRRSGRQCWWCVDSGAQQAGALQSSSGADVVGKASGLQKDIDDVSQSADQLTVSFYALLGWVLVVSGALLTVVAVTCWRWRRQRRRADWEDADSDCLSTSDTASIRSRPTTTSENSADAACRDRTALEGVEVGRRSHSVDHGTSTCAATEPWRCTDWESVEPVIDVTAAARSAAPPTRITVGECSLKRWSQLRFDCDSTVPHDNPHHDRAAALRPKYINRSA